MQGAATAAFYSSKNTVYRATMHLHQHSPAWGLPSFDPFCLSVHIYLKLVGNTTVEINNSNNPDISASGNLPVLFDGEECFSGTQKILRHLNKKVDLDRWLDTKQAASVAAFSVLVEEKLYRIMLYHWWVETENWQTVSQLPHFNSQTFPLNLLLPQRKRKEIAASFVGTSGEEVYAQAKEIYQVLADRLGNDEYFFGDRPCSLDAIVFGHLAVHLAARLESPKLRALLLAHKNLEEYCKRLLKQLFDYDLESLPPAVAIETDDKTENQESQVYSAMAKYGLVGGFIGLFIAARWWNSRHE